MAQNKTLNKPADDRMAKSQMVQTQEIRCPGCGRFLGKQAIVWGLVQLKCPNCKQWITLDVRPDA